MIGAAIGGIATGLVIALLLGWILGYFSDATAVEVPGLSAPQTNRLVAARLAARNGIKKAIALMCARKGTIISAIQQHKYPRDVSDAGCASLKAMVVAEVAAAFGQMPADAASIVPSLKPAVELWLEKAFQEYCRDTVDYEQVKAHAIRAVNDFCDPDGDFAHMLYKIADYAVVKPLSG